MEHKLEDEMNRNVTLIHPDKTVKYAGQILKAVDISCVVVVDRDRPLGIITERDIVRKVVASGRNPEELKVSDIMTPGLVTMRKDNTVEEAVDLMEKSRIKKIPIEEDGKIIGIVTMTDMMKCLRKIEIEEDGH